MVHRTVAGVNGALASGGLELPPWTKLNAARLDAGLQGGLIVASSQALREEWTARVAPFSLGVVSGWMAVGRLRQRRGADRGFVLSDHADWPGLNRAVEQSGAAMVVVMHGYDAVSARWVRERGLQAVEVERLGGQTAAGPGGAAGDINEED